ncbi:transglutaminase family protein [Cryobacterium sp. TMT1-21]|uniref:Transglutaminase family protein n=1 Tax=Cryobacterium shii TaxID=1259235 RepID=A0AAQ2C6T7_9MICO|nr:MULTISPECIES: transglutaminase family protein [Cryobacterium]TFC48215.1 transglutaminase family protein [Cryobacterium shii]TFC86249.1 transglutaminase family protein [Cryobacterium sp. TmT2-59]TFD12691.1 transglutaminase family protein [Cryobacterium sp. TMT1-21]
MNRLRIRHVTGYRYQGEVGASYNEARMLPVSSPDQFVLYAGLEISPVSSNHGYLDYWGTQVSSFEVLTPYTELTLTATSLVEVRPRTHLAHPLGWPELAAASRRSTITVEHARQTRLTDPPEDVAALAAEIVARRASPCDAALEICAAIGDQMQYVQGVTGVHSTARESWSDKRGVCQDITHIALGALRSAGIPARYVSGYLHSRPDAGIGETIRGESHAWVEWFCGDWRGYDPTNSIDIGDRHVAVGRGRDYNDVPPLRGVFSGTSGSELFVTVEITREA